MSVLGLATAALAAVYAVIGAHAVFLWGGRRRELYYGLFGVVCFCMAAYAGFAVVINESAVLSTVAPAQAGQLVVGGLATSFYLHFAYELAGRRGRLVPLCAHAVGAFALLLGGADLLVDAERPMGPLTWTFISEPNDVVAEPTRWAEVLEAAMLVQVLVAGYLHYAYRGARDTFRPPPYAPLILLAAGAWDVHIQIARIGMPYTVEFAFVVLALALSSRFVEHGARVSEELAQHTQALERGARRLEETKQQLVRREQLAAVGELSAIVAHELRNPLAVLQNTVAGLGKTALSDTDYQMLVTAMDEETDRLERLVSDLLSYVKPLELTRRDASLRAITAAVLARVERQQGSAGPIAVRQRVGADADRCFVDAELLRQALSNLVDNALHAGSAGVDIDVSASLVGGGHVVEIAVRDTGEGMPSDVAARASEPFFTTRSTGTGLGLAIVERIVRAHAGRLTIESSEQGGTTVRLLLPQFATSQPIGNERLGAESTLVGMGLA